MDKDLKYLLVFTVLYGLLAVGMLSLQPHSASLRVAYGIGNFQADSLSAVMAAAE
jgi:hypothetical protein